MTDTITLSRAVVQTAIDAYEAYRDRDDIETLDSAMAALQSALAQPVQQEPCYCDKNGIGEPGVSCGDCPTRDYKQPAQERKPLTREKNIALREGHQITISDEYFAAYPTHDNDAGRMLFERGFIRGWDAAHGIGGKT